MVRKHGIPVSEETLEARTRALLKEMLDIYHLEANRPYNATQLSKRPKPDKSYGRLYSQQVTGILEPLVKEGLIGVRVNTRTRYKIPTLEYFINPGESVHIIAEYVTGRELRAA